VRYSVELYIGWPDHTWESKFFTIESTEPDNAEDLALKACYDNLVVHDQVAAFIGVLSINNEDQIVPVEWDIEY